MCAAQILPGGKGGSKDDVRRGKGALRSNKAPLIHCGKELSNYNKRLLLGGR
jgi:hypothetical protein